MADRYEDALRIVNRQPVDTRSKFARVFRAASLASFGELDKAKVAAADAVARHPDLTAEGFANEPGFNDVERKKLAEKTRDAGFPTCAKPEQLASSTKPMRLYNFEKPSLMLPELKENTVTIWRNFDA